MSESEDIDLLAAEYALGTLPAAERASVALRARMEPTLAAAIEDWERRLSPLSETIAAREVPADLWARIEDRIDAQAGGSSVVGIER
ncbi:MAG: RNA polymerase subunit sigma-70, partial [Hyphomicrobium sp.]|nr:RNA polymerase subunit sigma-70 [Hyphomicrobium sp.]